VIKKEQGLPALNGGVSVVEAALKVQHYITKVCCYIPALTYFLLK